MEGAREYLGQRVIPDATYRNWNSYSSKTSFAPGVNVMEAFSLLPDPQTNGGLLVAVSASSSATVREIFSDVGLAGSCEPIGMLVPAAEKTIIVKQ